MEPSNKSSPFHQAGFTLVEIMVGLAIGMLATLVIMQVISVFETQKRVTTGTADAQTNGGIALYNIGRELQIAGYPLMPVTDSPLECSVLTFGATGIGGISPVTITDGVAGPGVSASDTITIRYGNSLMGGVPTRITAMGAPNANDATIDNNFGCQAGDNTLVINGTTCAISSASAVAGTTTVTLADTTAAAVGANLACLGIWNEITYAVNSGNLTRNGAPSVTGIVNLQAQYGISATANSNQVAQWVNATTGGIWDPALISVANRNRIKAVRIAVMARNPKMEPNNVTSSPLTAWNGGPTIDLSAGDPDWLRYRYRVFETIVPLRNVIWSKDTL